MRQLCCEWRMPSLCGSWIVDRAIGSLSRLIGALEQLGRCKTPNDTWSDISNPGHTACQPRNQDEFTSGEHIFGFIKAGGECLSL